VRILILIGCLIWASESRSENFRISKMIGGFNRPWSLTFIDDVKILVTEKSGSIIVGNLNDKSIKKINHNLSITDRGQGGLLDILYKDKMVFISYSDVSGGGKSSTAIAVSDFSENNMDFKNIFKAIPPISSGYHFGSRIVIKGKFLYASLGERGGGMIAQDASKHPGSIIRIHLDGTIPSDNPFFTGHPNWLPEIFQIGIRNPQGISFSPFDGEVYISNHGARGGDWFGKVVKSGNYGWKILGWGGTNYDGTEIGPKWKPGFTKALHYWVPSIATSAIAIYKGNEFKEWEGQALVTSLKDQSLRRLTFNKERVLKEEILFKNKIGRIRDIKIEKKSGKVFLLTDGGVLWKLER
jgi:aldose sugar dehydrogenase